MSLSHPISRALSRSLSGQLGGRGTTAPNGTLIVVGGDSISDVNDPTWPEILQTYLGDRYTVVNHSVIGRTIAEGNTAFAAEVGATLEASTAGRKIAICELSSNSLSTLVSVADCKTQLTTWINAAKAAGANRVIVCTTLNRGDMDSFNDTFAERADELAVWIREDTDNLGIECLDLRADLRFSDFDNLTAFNADQVHQTQAGNRWIAQDAYAAIRGLSDGDASSWNSRIATAGGTQSSDWETANIRLMQRATLSGIKNKFVIGAFDTGNAGGNAVRSDGSTSGTFSGTNSHDTDGVDFGAAGYFDANYNPSVSGWGGMGLHVPNTLSTEFAFDMGCFEPSPGPSLILALNVTTPTLRADFGNNTGAGGGGALLTATEQTAAGLYLQYLSGATTGKVDRYLSSGSTSIVSDTIGTTGGGIGGTVDGNIFVGGAGGDGGPFASGRKYSYWFVLKETLTAAEIVDLAAMLEAWKRERVVNSPITDLTIDSAVDDGSTTIFELNASWTLPAGYDEIVARVRIKVNGTEQYNEVIPGLTTSYQNFHNGSPGDTVEILISVLGKLSVSGNPSTEATDSGTVAAASLRGSLVTGYNFALIADDLEGVDASNVTSWDGDGVIVTNPGTAPTLQTNEINGKNAVLFTSSITPLAGTLSSSITSPATYFLVVKPDGVSGLGFFADLFNSGDTDRQVVWQNDAKVAIYSTGGLESPDAILAANTPAVITAYFDGSSSTFWFNGLTQVTGNPGPNSTVTDLVLGSEKTFGIYPFEGKIASIIGYEGALSQADREANENAIGSHYGITIDHFPGIDILDSAWEGQDFRLLTPVGLDPTTAAPLVIYHHGAGETSTSISGSDKEQIVRALILAGYRILSPEPSEWGNQAGQDAVKSTYDVLITNYNTNKTVFLSQSMGGLNGLLMLADSANWSQVEGWYGIYPVCNLADMYAGGYQSSIQTAYDIPGGGTYAAQTAGHDPVLLSASLFAGKRLRFTASYSDTVVDRANNSDEMSTLVSGVADEYEVVTHTGDHGSGDAFLPSDIVSFFGRCS
jgi:hypothetical protein